MKKKRKKGNKFFIKFKKVILKLKDSFFVEASSDAEEVVRFSIKEVVLIVFISILFGIVVGYVITNNRNFTKNNSSNLNEVADVYNNIIKNYYGELSPKELSDAAIKGMLDSLDDPYSNYMDSDTTSSFNESIDGKFVGIGVTVKPEEEYNRIIEVKEGGPADKAGIKENDVIIKVNGKSVKGLHGEKLTSLIRGDDSKKVKLTVKRGEEEKVISIKRDVIEVDTAKSEVIEYEGKSIGYIQVTSFASNTFKQFRNGLEKIEKEGIDSLIIDVRDNPGGHLLQTRRMLSLFFPKDTVLYQIESKKKKNKVKSLNNEKRDYPVVVLINKGSASAAEILASCFQDNYDKGILIGETSYGKGTVQKSKLLKGGTSIKYTVQKWLTSKGKWVHEKGIKPDLVVTQSEDYYEEPVRDKDKQLQEALKEIKKEFN